MFDGTVISKGDTSREQEVDVEDDETATYGPSQYPHNDLATSGGTGLNLAGSLSPLLISHTVRVGCGLLVPLT